MTETSNFTIFVESLTRRARWRESLLLGLIVLFFIAFILWAAITEIDDVTRGDGRIVPSRNVQVVQTVEAGILEKLHISEGQRVDEGTVLMELDPTILGSQLDEEQQRAIGLRARIARLQAEISDAATLVFPHGFQEANLDILNAEKALFDARRAELAAEIQVLERQRTQRIQELEEGRIAELMEAETRELVDREFALMEPLVLRKLEPETTLLALYRARAESNAAMARAAASIVRLEAALAEVDDRVVSIKSRFRAEALTQISEATADLAELETRLPALAQRVKRTEIRAPVRGIVNRVHLTTIGGVAQAGQPLVEIVPLDDTLLVEAYVRPADIAFVYPGQPVRVKITAYDFSRYGGLDGEIVRVGADAIPRPDRPAEEEKVFVVQIQTSSNILDAEGSVVEIVPGMVAEVDILSGRRTVMDYITEPIARVRDRALRD